MPHSQLDFSLVSSWERSLAMYPDWLGTHNCLFIFVGFLFCFEAGFLLVALAVLKLAL